jgi:hypothetical protein
MSNSTLDYIRSHYKVPARIGGRVLYTGGKSPGGQLGTITGTAGRYLLIRLDGDADSRPYHPTWKLEFTYHESDPMYPK